MVFGQSALVKNHHDTAFLPKPSYNSSQLAIKPLISALEVYARGESYELDFRSRR